MKKIDRKSLGSGLIVILCSFCASMFLFPAGLAAEEDYIEDYIWKFEIPVALSNMVDPAEYVGVSVSIWEGDKFMTESKIFYSGKIKDDGSLNETVTVLIPPWDMYQKSPRKATKYIARLKSIDSGSKTPQYIVEDDSGPNWTRARSGSVLTATGYLNQSKLKGNILDTKPSNSDFKIDLDNPKF